METINEVAIIGGIHGNEFTGAYLVKKFQQLPELAIRTSFRTQVLLANPRAFQAARRYIDTDLNRCFFHEELSKPQPQNYETQRAQEINRILGPKGKPRVDFILDLHSSTANMGLTIILVNDNPFNLRLAAYLTSLSDKVRIYLWTKPNWENPFLNSLCELGFSIEVGPIVPGTLKANIFQETEALVENVLDYLDKYNQSLVDLAPQTVTVYQHVGDLDYPKNENGEIEGMIHPQLQGKDYQELQPGDPLFLTLAGETIYYQGESSVWPLFINEAAYYEKGVAMCLTQKKIISF